MSVQTLLRRLVVEWSDGEDGGIAGEVSVTDFIDKSGGAVAAHSGYERYPSGRIFHCATPHLGLFGSGQGRRLAGGAKYDEIVRSVVDDMVYDSPERWIVYIKV